MNSNLLHPCLRVDFSSFLAGLGRLALTLAALLWPLGGLISPAEPVLAFGPGDAPPAPSAPAAGAPAMLQFKSGGHMLGFQPGKVYLAGLDHALSVEFAGAAQVMPQADALPSSKLGRGSAGENFSRVTYAGLWPGISLSYEAQPGGIAKSTYLVAPGADPNRIRLRTNTPAELLADGSLRFAFAAGSLTESAPLAWQDIAGRRVPVSVAFHLGGPTGRLSLSRREAALWTALPSSRRSSVGGQPEIGFTLGAYDPAYPLTIDPGYTWHTFYGQGIGTGIAVDADGNIYVVGYSEAAWNGPGTSPVAPLHAHSGGEDIVVVKLSSSGAYRWHTFYGNSGGDEGRGIAVDAGGNVYVTGYSVATWNGPGSCTTSGVSPCPFNAFSGTEDIVVIKLTGGGDYLWHTFYGSSDHGYGIAVDAGNNVYVVGDSDLGWDGPGGVLPLHPFISITDIVVVKLSGGGAYQWHTFYGGGNDDAGYGIAADAGGNVYIVGYSEAAWNGPGTCTTPGTSPCPLNPYSGGEDIVVVKLAGGGNYQWHTFYGGSGSDEARDIAVDGGGNVYVTGFSVATWDGPGTSPVAPLHAHSGTAADLVVIRLNDSGAYQWHTFYGGSTGFDSGMGIVVRSGGGVYVSGYSWAAWNGPGNELPLNAYDDGMYANTALLKLDGSGNYQWHTFYGSGNDYGFDIAVGTGGAIYVAGFSTIAWDGPGGASPLHPFSALTDIVVVRTDNYRVHLPAILK